MTKQDDKKDQEYTQEQSSLGKKLEEIQQEKHNKEEINKDQEIFALQQKISELEQQKEEHLEIAKKAQYNYINLKTDFDRFQRITLEKEKSIEIDSLIKHVKKLLPVIDQLRTSLDHADQSFTGDSFAAGVKMVYDNMLKALESLGIKPIESIWLVPDTLLHEPLSTLPVEDESLKGKIIQEFQRWYYLEYNGERTVIITSKVIVWV